MMCENCKDRTPSSHWLGVLKFIGRTDGDGQAVGRSGGRAVGRSGGRTVGRSGTRPGNRPPGRANGRTLRPTVRLAAMRTQQ